MVILRPAYGRKYKTKKEMLDDWDGGKDFKILGGPYCSIRDLKSLLDDFRLIEIQYGIETKYSYFIEGDYNV